MNRVRPIAIYLPQFHPIPENDSWWGKGFTEWTNVTKAKPLFKGHYQPHLPSDLGFYDLRVHASQVEQAKIAKQYGITGFCYYHYWFNGKRVLHRPVEQLLVNGTPEMPFMLCWANENWTRTWDGLEKNILLKQEYSEEDDLEHIRYLCTIFRDPRYIRVNGKPVFIVYRPALFPDMKRTAALWREECRKNGTGEIYLMYMQSFSDKRDPSELGFDAAVEFQPDFASFPPPKMTLHGGTEKKGDDNKVFEYGEVVDRMLAKQVPAYKLFRSVFPGWDNTARRTKGAIIVDRSNPELYQKWLKETIKRFEPYSKEENFVFINAWNEWAEGNHLEPDMKWGRAYLEATGEVLRKN